MKKTNEITVCIGSNVTDGHRKVTDALTWLTRILLNCKSHGPYPTEPYGDASSERQYFNAVAIGQTSMSETELNCIFKDYENRHGRKRDTRKEIAIDLDLVICNGRVLRQSDFNAPYFTEGFNHLRK